MEPNRRAIGFPFQTVIVHEKRFEFLDPLGGVWVWLVSEPRAVEDAGKLVATVMEHIAQGLANERSSLERQWSSGDPASTEDLRIALQRYRSFFVRLLNA